MFTGNFSGRVDGHFAAGFWSVAVNHEPLSDVTGEKSLMSGEWKLTVYVLNGFLLQKKTFGGPLSGVLYNRGDNNLPVDNFDLFANLQDLSMGGVYAIGGILRHNTFPPTVNLQFGVLP
jgi:hypothetical protein